MTFTKEQLLNQARENVKALKMAVVQNAFKDIRTAIELDLALAELALAGMEAEPVAMRPSMLFDQFVSSITKGQRGLPDALIKDGVVDYEKIGVLWEEYRSAPQPLTTSERAELENYRNAQQVVPGGRPAYEVGAFGMITIKANGHSLDFDLSDFDFKDGAQCRQDGGFIWKKGLQGIINAIQAHCDSLSNGIQEVAIKWDSENPPVAMQSGEVKDGCDHEWVHHVPCLKPEYEQCRKCNVRREMFENCWVQNESQAGNSPVIPDGWVACSERMPEDAQWCAVSTEYGYYVQCWSHGQGWLGDDISIPNCDVTHWMPIPAAPQQEISK